MKSMAVVGKIAQVDLVSNCTMKCIAAVAEKSVAVAAQTLRKCDCAPSITVEVFRFLAPKTGAEGFSRGYCPHMWHKAVENGSWIVSAVMFLSLFLSQEFLPSKHYKNCSRGFSNGFLEVVQAMS